jgi:hypothetical protein
MYKVGTAGAGVMRSRPSIELEIKFSQKVGE